MKIEEILAVKYLSVEFQTSDGKKQVVKDVSLSIRQGEVLALVGESGCGKTVLCRSILKLLPKSASVTGEAIQYKDQNLIGYNEKEMQQIRGHGIAMVFQDPQSTLNPTMTVGSQIEEAILLHEKALKQNKKESAKEWAIELMKLVGIKDAEQRYDLYPYHFSGGMRQRVMIAMALACEPSLLIADEPTTALDVTIQAQILKLMNELKKEKGTSILFITHDLGVINQMADEVAVMYCGQVVEMCKARTIFAKETTCSHPYTEGLMTSIPRLDTPVGARLEAIPGAVPHPLNLPKGCKFAPRCKYATEKCMNEEPKLELADVNHLIRCFYPDKEARHAK